MVFAALLVAQAAGAECSAGNLLEGRRPVSSRGVENPERLTDGLLAFDGDDAHANLASPMTGLRPYVEWDLGEPVRVRAAAVQADNNDAYRLTGSLDGRDFEPLWAVEPVDGAGLRERSTKELDRAVRYVRFEALSGDRYYAASEVRVFCEVPAVWPPTRVVRAALPDDPVGLRRARIQSFKIVLGLVAFPLLFWFLPRASARWRRRTLSALVLLSALSWIQFGSFHGASSIHYWDAFHYFMGTKYFPELGYFELYRCGARAERQAGNGAALDAIPFRNLDDGRLYPGDWTRTSAGRCRARFSAERWDAFRSDMAAFHGLFSGRTVPEAFGDHGFNATPLDVAWLRLFTHSAAVSARRLVVLAQLDTLALAGTVAVLFWGFGSVPGALAALVLGIGAPWSYDWVGGCLGRATWLFFLAAGFALLRRGRPFLGGAALVVAGLLRLFPLVFVGGALVWVLVGVLLRRRIEPDARRFIAGAALAAALGGVTAGAAVGFSSYREFAGVVVRHAGTPLTNHVGLSTLLGWTAGENSDSLADSHLTDPFERWQRLEMQHRTERRPLWLLVVATSLAVIVIAAWRGAPAVACAAFSGLLLFALLPTTSYDYAWLVVLVALAERRSQVGAALLAFALFTQVLFVFGGDTLEAQHLWISAACAALLAVSVPWRELFAFPQNPS